MTLMEPRPVSATADGYLETVLGVDAALRDKIAARLLA